MISVFTISDVWASCIFDPDWPENPCLDTPPYSKTYLTELADKYYESKGQEWMEMKKTEMDYAIEKGLLEEWFSYEHLSGGSENYNVYFYYFVHDQAPSYGWYFDVLLNENDKNPTIGKYSSTKNDSEIIITYYYVNSGDGLF